MMSTIEGYGETLSLQEFAFTNCAMLSATFEEIIDDEVGCRVGFRQFHFSRDGSKGWASYIRHRNCFRRNRNIWGVGNIVQINETVGLLSCRIGGRGMKMAYS